MPSPVPFPSRSSSPINRNPPPRLECALLGALPVPFKRHLGAEAHHPNEPTHEDGKADEFEDCAGGRNRRQGQKSDRPPQSRYASCVFTEQDAQDAQVDARAERHLQQRQNLQHSMHGGAGTDGGQHGQHHLDIVGLGGVRGIAMGGQLQGVIGGLGGMNGGGGVNGLGCGAGVNGPQQPKPQSH
ncbi:hypothetical protein CVT25_009226 [Psilocybe cyanescens]|uniref:Uncharacterized protein n=1 Tax=Psilocybe cyanescens TaxID=93625 RepID=A0A409WW55_PSICY|nr:hypothetical protein CVT25_009226 [Psilocybe cyanescens]